MVKPENRTEHGQSCICCGQNKTHLFTHAYLLLEQTVEDEDEHALQSVEDGEEVSHDNGGLVEKEQPKRPCQA